MKKKIDQFLIKYKNNLVDKLNFSFEYNANSIRKGILEIKKIKKQNKRIFIFGNGGSSAICSHFASDISNIANIKCHNFSEATFITCFANDYGYENWCKKCIEIYGNSGDLLIAISSSGESKNILNVVKLAKIKKFSNIISLSGFEKNNSLNKISKNHINIWVESKEYNIIENIHQMILLTMVDYFKK